MATIYTHAIVGLGLGKALTKGRKPVLFWALAAFLPVLPDFDAFLPGYYGSILGHRGFTHSLPFALWVGFLTASLTYRYFRMNIWGLTGLFTLMTASHGILDAFTHAGFGIPFFWPIAESRYGPWGPIHVADIAFDLPNPWTSRALPDELLWVWLPTAVVVSLVMWYRWMRRRHVKVEGTTAQHS